MINKIIDLFFIFIKIGFTTFGGGYSMLPILDREIVEKKQYLTKEEILDYYAISQCMPGAIAINTAGFIGYRLIGNIGIIVGILGMIIPSIITILIISSFISNISSYNIYNYAFSGIKLVISALILNTAYGLFKISIINIYSFICFLFALVLLMFNINPLIVILIMSVVTLLKIGFNK